MRAVKSSGLINLENLHLIVRQHHITTSKKNLGLFPGKNFADLEEVRCVSEDDKQSSVGRPRTCLFCLFPREMYDNKVTFFPTGFMTLFSKSIQKKSFKGPSSSVTVLFFCSREGPSSTNTQFFLVIIWYKNQNAGMNFISSMILLLMQWMQSFLSFMEELLGVNK